MAKKQQTLVDPNSIVVQLARVLILKVGRLSQDLKEIGSKVQFPCYNGTLHHEIELSC